MTYQRKGDNELAVQALNIIVADLQTQINNLSGGSGSGGGGDPDGIGTMYFFIFICLFILYLYVQTCWNEYLYIPPEVIKPCLKMHFSKHPLIQQKNINNI